MKFKSDIEVQAGLKDSSGAAGTSGQVLSTTVTGVSWVNPDGFGYVPYTGATANVDLGNYSLSAYDLIINHSSGSGVAASITKGGNGEALTVVKSSGTGNAASITGGTTLISELHLTTDLADDYIASAATWNAKQSALNGTGFVKISGSTISYDNSTYVPTSRTLTINGTAYDLSADRSWTISAGVTGTGTTNYIPKFTGTSALGNSNITDNGTVVAIITDATINGVNIGRGGGAIATNTRVGTIALNSNTTGSGNSAFGISALNANTTGGSNIAIGRAALEANTTGTTNTAVGTFSLLSNISGSNNVSLGFNSGRFIADGTTANTISNTSIFIGVSTKALADNQTNQIVIGNNAVGLGSNTTVLGNSSTTTTAIYGNLGIGTTSPSNLLSVGVANSTTGKGITIENTSGSVYARFGVINPTVNNDTYIGSMSNNNFLIYSNASERMRITSGGNVGIGTAIPSFKLQVEDSSIPTVAVFKGGGGGAYSTFNIMTLGANGNGYWRAPTIGSNIKMVSNAPAINVTGFSASAITFGADANQGRIGFFTTSSNTGDALLTESLRINTTGNVLINTTTDAGYKLDVNGTGRFNGSIQVGQGNAGSGTPTQSIFQDTYGGNRDTIYVKNTADYSPGRGAGYGFLNGAGTQKGYIRWSADDASQSGYFITLGTTNSSGTLITPFTLASTGGAYFSSLAGSGTRFVTADANGLLSTTTDGAITSYNSTLTLNTSWQNTGIDSSIITTSGVYLVTCYVSDFAVGGGQYYCTYVGTMFFYAGGTNNVNENEIPLHHSGHADQGRYIYLRTLSSYGADSKLYLQIKGNGTNTGNSTYVFTFKKLL